MSLILAVEPDRRQAKQLKSLVRQHIRAELVVADSGSAAVESLDGRIPDLILTPALLPPKDEAVLTGWLRELGDAAAHVQTLAIPILADGEQKAREQQGSSIFGRLRDAQPESAPGCDPGVFADQVRVYLDRAGTDRSSRVPDEPVERQLAAAEPPPSDVEDFDAEVTFDDLVFEPGPSVGPEPVAVPPAAEPPATVHMPSVFTPANQVDEDVLRGWESELGLENPNPTPTPTPSLSPTPVPAAPWRASHHEPADPVPTRVTVTRDTGGRQTFDPGDALYAPLFRRLEELATAHA